jgi:hypothetical protein
MVNRPFCAIDTVIGDSELEFYSVLSSSILAKARASVGENCCH